MIDLEIWSTDDITPDIRLVVDYDFLKSKNLSIQDPENDDAFYIQCQNGCGMIVGSNSRSVLIGVYALLEQAGCRYVRPGKEGEILGKSDLRQGTYNICESADMRHRGVVIEGANSITNLLDFIDWLPKIRMNSFFTQFQSIHLFFQRYYEHWNQPALSPEPYSRERTQHFEQLMEIEMSRRGIIRHAVGHGWTCGALGVEGVDWEPVAIQEDESVRPYIALVEGKRAFFHRTPSTTNLCYSNPQARTLLVNYIANYLQEHPQIDIAHVWLADDCNNFCQCNGCKEKLPSDWYLLLLNELDAQLTKRKLSTHIAFLAYLDLMWPPATQKIKNPSRFLFMFAPYTREYGQTIFNVEPQTMQPYSLNHIMLPVSVGENLAYLKAWKKLWRGDSFCFDYYLGRAHYGDLGYMKLSQVIAKDVQGLSQLDLNGLLSCQELRCAFPTGLPNYIMGKKLWNTKAEIEQIIAEYFSAAFGCHSDVARSYLENVSIACDIDEWMSIQVKCRTEKDWREASKAAKHFSPSIEAECSIHTGSQLKSWQLLLLHTQYVQMLATALAYRREANQIEARKAFRQLATWLSAKEEILQPMMDIYRIIQLGKLRGLDPWNCQTAQ